MKQMWHRYFWILTFILVAGCGLVSGEDEADGRVEGEPERITNDQSAPSDELEYDGDPPGNGKGQVYGEVRWNSQPQNNNLVELCADFSSFSGCRSERIETWTGEDGRFLFEDVTPGIYALSIQIPDTQDKLYISSGIFSSADFEVEAGKTLIAGIHDIFRLNVNLQFPANGAKVSVRDVQLRWQEYTEIEKDVEMGYYKVSLYPEQGDTILVDERTNEPSFTVELPPLNCSYRWEVEVFNSDRIKVAETAEQFDFVVSGQPGNCVLTIQEPADGAEIRGDNIVLDWEDNPQAVTYKILMWNDDDPEKANILNFEEVNESSYRFSVTLEPARYVWSVDAYDEDGNQIGGTEIVDFTVRP